MYTPHSWTKTLLWFALCLGIAAIVGLIFNKLWLSLVIPLLIILGLTYYRLYKLSNWLWQTRTMTPPDSSGIWYHIYEGVYYLQRRSRSKRKNLGELVKRFREGSEALPDAALVIDKDTNIIWCNRNAKIELSLRWPEDKGRRIDNLIRHPQFIDFLHEGNYQFPIEIPAPTNPNKMFEYRIMAYGEDQLMLIIRDVTRVYQLEKMRKDFVANVSHELKTPLTVINGYIEVLESCSEGSPPIMGKALSEMGAQSKRMQVLINDLLVLSRIESSNERIFEKVVDMSALFTQIELEAQALNNDKQHNLTFNIDKNLKVYGVETELRSACSNLIFNALNYTPENGKIVVSWQRNITGALFSVKDNGEGIEDKHLRRLTERFYRVDNARSRRTGGSGLGLSIVKHVLHHHNSKLKIKSSLGKGSEFSFLLPDELIADD